ncbi:hypothetical protein O77CONTIG1_03998 [Leptolyngbya sp. O-77]|nr:hypothetical protein O77CONTIG1_03998 [Leptolyngbya sp. O-77]
MRSPELSLFCNFLNSISLRFLLNSVGQFCEKVPSDTGISIDNSVICRVVNQPFSDGGVRNEPDALRSLKNLNQSAPAWMTILDGQMLGSKKCCLSGL